MTTFKAKSSSRIKISGRCSKISTRLNVSEKRRNGYGVSNKSISFLEREPAQLVRTARDLRHILMEE